MVCLEADLVSPVFESVTVERLLGVVVADCWKELLEVKLPLVCSPLAVASALLRAAMLTPAPAACSSPRC